MTKEQLEYLERIRQLVELIKEQDNYTARLISLNAILKNIEHIKQGENICQMI